MNIFVSTREKDELDEKVQLTQKPQYIQKRPIEIILF